MIQQNALSERWQAIVARFAFQFFRIKKLGFSGVLKRLIKRLVMLILAILFFPVSVILYSFNYRRFVSFTDRVGHLAIEPDTILKAQMLNLIISRRWVILAPPQRVANQYLMNYWKKYFYIVESKFSCFMLEAIFYWPFMRHETAYIINNDNSAQYAYQVNAMWGNRPPLLMLTEDDKKFGDEKLVELGLPQNVWFVCVHAREGGFSPQDETLHSHRNGQINNLLLAIQEITRRGGWVIRLGDPTTMPLNQMPQVIDYAHHPLRSARLDVILCVKSRFILGNTSGIFIVGTVFGTPCALVNMIPVATLGFMQQDISIPKLLKKDNRYLSFTEVMNSPISQIRYASIYEQQGITIEENSPEDILDVTIEMLDRLDGIHVVNIDDEKLHDQYMSLFKPQHYSYAAISKVSHRFLRRHQQLLMKEDNIV